MNALAADFGKQLENPAAAGDEETGGDRGERLENEGPAVEFRVGKREERGAAAATAVRQEIEVDRARPLRRAAHAAERGFDAEERAEKRFRGQRSLDQGGGVEEARLRGADGIGLDEGGASHDARAGEAGDRRERFLEKLPSVAQVRAEPDRGPRLHGDSGVPVGFFSGVRGASGFTAGCGLRKNHPIGPEIA